MCCNLYKKSNFVRDLHAERILGTYLDQYFYPRLEVKNIKRESNLQEQFHGIDITFNDHNKTYLVDEKGLLSIPDIINTFAFELSYLNKSGRRNVGWFFDNEKKTTDYLLCWVKRDDISLDSLSANNIHYVLAMLLNRAVLQEYLMNSYGITSQSALNKSDEIVQAGIGGRLHNISENSNSRYHYSDHLPEQPVNLVITKRELLKSGSIDSFHLVKRKSLTKAR